MLPKFCLDDNVRSAFRSPRGSFRSRKNENCKTNPRSEIAGISLITASLTTIPLSLQSSKQTHIASTGKRCFEGKGQTPLGERLDFAEHHPPCTECGSLRRKWCHPLRNQVGIDEILTIRVVGQKLPCERGLAHAIRPRDDKEIHEASHPTESEHLRHTSKRARQYVAASLSSWETHSRTAKFPD